MSTPDDAVGADTTDEREVVSGPPVRLRTVLLSLGAAVLAIALFGAGWFVGRPSYPGERSIDAGFARDMQQHHGQAVDMSLIVRSAGAKSDVMTLAYDIATTQENQRGEMRGWLETWGVPAARSEPAMAWMTRTGHEHPDGKPMLLPDGRMQGMASDASLNRLRSSKGRSAELLYLRLMIPHHRAGVEMAKACVSACSDPQVVGLARTMVNGQQAEIGLMNQFLRARGESTL